MLHISLAHFGSLLYTYKANHRLNPCEYSDSGGYNLCQSEYAESIHSIPRQRCSIALQNKSHGTCVCISPVGMRKATYCLLDVLGRLLQWMPVLQA